ncbi:unnamed protein product [Gulo gulo]|uniref:Uncharacterized protein n=1 Tax=Gulo gulo TaxID=48420 RepID=A0A9X9M6K6_GULGU|nr:unnamed protein product [Gulo gulo]
MRGTKSCLGQHPKEEVDDVAGGEVRHCQTGEPAKMITTILSSTMKISQIFPRKEEAGRAPSPAYKHIPFQQQF